MSNERYVDHICVDISYENEEGLIQSDLCYDKTKMDNKTRKTLHMALDEWIDKANGTGQFRLWHENTILAEVVFDEGIHP